MEQDDKDNKKAIEVSGKSSAGSTLLPEPIANVVSLVTRSSSLYLRLGTFVGGLALDGARVTTLTGLELSRALIEAILIRSGREVSERSIGEVGRAEAEGILDKSVATLHRTITGISFAASTGFHFSSAILSSATDLSQQLLGALDSILGSTDSSRAIASIITLIRREFQNPATGREGEKVGVADLLSGICGLALLQRWCKKMTELEYREGKFEEVVWDVVILDNGRRADVIGQTDGKFHIESLSKPDSMSFMSTRGGEVLETIERDGEVKSDSEDDLQEIHLRQRIMRSLPVDSSVSIITSTRTIKTITVEITGTQPPDLSLPPGIEIIEENAHHAVTDALGGAASTTGKEVGVLLPTYRVVYQIKRDNERSSSVKPYSTGQNHGHVAGYEELPMAVSPRPATFTMSPLSSPEMEEMTELFPASSPQAEDISAQGYPETELKELPPPLVNEDRTPKNITDNYSNQKRTRKPMSSSSSVSGTENQPPRRPGSGKTPPVKKSKVDKPPTKPADKKNSIRNAIKRGSNSTLSHFLTKDTSVTDINNTSPQTKEARKPAWGSPATPSKSNLPVRSQDANMTPLRDAPRPPQRGNPNYFSSRDLGLKKIIDTPRSPSRSSHYLIPDQLAESVVSHTETYSVHSAESRPGSPTAYRTHLRAHSNLLRSRSEKNISNSHVSPSAGHRRTKSHVPSIYTLQTNDSMTSLVLASRSRHSAFEDSETLENMARSGLVDGMFPQHHLVRNITRFVRFASASYGSSFLRVMGIMATDVSNKDVGTSHHHEHHSFSSHTQLPADTILLSSFVDPQGGTDSTGKTNTGVPMVHFVSLDHDSKAVVLTCRGTLGFEDVLTDMTCDYDILTWRGQDYSVHKGIHASARRLLDGKSSRVMATITAALEEFPDYGLVLCGHSLGGGVTALLAVMISEPSPDITSTAFITSSKPPSPRLLLTSGEESGTAPTTLYLPPGRPVHVYAYGPPATLSPSLRLATRGLITTIVNGQDLVPYLSLGVLHDLQAVALAFKTDESGAKGQFQSRVWAGITESLRNKWYAGSSEGVGAFGSGIIQEEDDQWAYSALKALRACMLSSKLLPPGEVFVVESCPVLKRDAFIEKQDDQPSSGSNTGSGLGRPATRAVLKYVRNVEKKFGEVKFGGSMLLDHSPARYEASLGALGRGVLG
jgi:pimeloyl-ACP methyl ester carboxylesterase